MCLLIIPVIAVQPADVYIQAAEKFRNNSDWVSSGSMYEKASDLSGGRYDLLREGARMYAEGKDYQKAIDTMNRSMLLGGEHPSSYLFMGLWAMEEFNNTTIRDEYLNKAISSDVYDAVDSYNKAMAQAFLGDIDGGLATIDNGTTRFNTTDYLWDWRGLFEAAKGNYSESGKSYENAFNLSKNPESKAMYLMQKAKYLTMGGFLTPDEIKDLMKQAVSLDKDMTPYFEPFIGMAYLQKGDYKNASPHFAIEKSSGYMDYTLDSLLRADFQYKTGQKQEAVKTFSDAVKRGKDPINNTIWTYLSRLIYLNQAELGLLNDSIERGDNKSAMEYVNSLIKRNPDVKFYKEKLTEVQNMTSIRR